MAIQDKRIDELAVASQIKETDLFVVEQNGVAKSVSGQVVNDYAANAAIRAGVALPAGGTVGQVLTKTANASEWADVDGLPSGGTVGQVLTKTASGASWQNTKTELPSGGENGFVLAKLDDGAEWVEAGTPTQAQTDSAVSYWLDNHPEATTTVQDGSITEDKLATALAAKINTIFSNSAKDALLALLSHVAYTDEHGQDYLDALEDALYPPAPPASLVSIEAVFTQGSTVIYDTATLDDLKPMLTVTATYDDSTTEPVSNYTLSGTLTAGTSTITVSYGGKTDTFDVTVTSSQPIEVEMVDMSEVYSTVYSDNGQTELKKGSSTAFASAETFDEDTQVTIELLYGSTNAGLKQYAASWDGSGVGNASSPYIGYYGEIIGAAQTTAYTATYTVKAGNRLLIKNFNAGRWQKLTVTK